MKNPRRVGLAVTAVVLALIAMLVGLNDDQVCGSAWRPGDQNREFCADSIDLRQDWAFGLLQLGAVSALLAVVAQPTRRPGD